MRNEVVRVERERFDQVVDALCAAFQDYPVMRYVLKDAGVDFERRLPQLIAYLTESRFCRGYPVLGVEDGERLAAAANVNPPRTLPPPDSLTARYATLRERIGADAIARFEAFGAACDGLEPDEPHYYLGMIGVRPEHQGRGLARLLLDELHAMSARDPESRGVVLTTETEANLPLYEHFGYRILGQGQADELVSWTLFRPDPE
jgi:GNAT superfamily N-acetyltransferase